MYLRGTVKMMSEKVKSEILFHIQNEVDQAIDEKQIINHVEKTSNGYQLGVYGKTLRFNNDGDLL